MRDPNREEQLYAQAAAELGGGNRDEGLWAKCFAECDGDENKAKALYLKKRVERLVDPEDKPPVFESKKEESPEIQKDDHKGLGQYTTVGGWLLFFCITLTICRPLLLCGTAAENPFSEGTVAMEIRGEYRRLNGEELSWEESKKIARETIAEIETNSELRSLLIFIKVESIVNGAMGVFCFVCGCGLWARQKWALKWTKISLWASLIIVLVDLVVAAYLDTIPVIREFTGAEMATSSEAIKGLTQAVVYFAIWYSYLLKSKRVKNTQWV